MKKKDFFVSYNKEDNVWAKWVAGTLEESGYSVYLQAWDIEHGDDFIDQMNKFLESSKGYIPIISNNFLNSNYCKKELSTAFNKHLEGIGYEFKPIRVEDVLLGTLYKTTVYVDIFNLDEIEAKKNLLNGVNVTNNPRKKGAFPGKNETKNQLLETENTVPFPGEAQSVKKNHKNTPVGQIKIRDILILEKEKNRRGDLFNRLVCDVFHALGFGEPRYNVQKSGREIDLILQHRTENRFAIVESKALSSKVGGDDINKFVGVFDVEKGKYKANGSSVIGYFISKSGFTETAILQEEERKNAQSSRDELVLLGPTEIVRELIQGNMLCSLESAISKIHINNLDLCKNVDLIACEQGWVWVLYYSSLPKQTATHFAFVHADGNTLLSNISETLISKSNSLDVAFSKLTYLNPSAKNKLNQRDAKDAYFKYLENELGEIQFEGMPTDKDAGSVKVNLENIFVPLGFNFKTDLINSEDLSDNKTDIVGVLERSSKAAILAKPGGGKSTLIRRIALAYAFPERRLKVDDSLPDNNWFPIYIRCRDLGDDAIKSILEIIGSIACRAEITKFNNEFNELIENELQMGTALLLIDGLDEISSENYRFRFVNQLRTFVATYPKIHLVLTSRVAGFRTVAGTLASYCEQYTIADFNNEQISSLSLKWHRAVMGDTGNPEDESEKVCNIIFNDPRIVILAENPLLLTTLLFVKRWVGYLPTKKCQLYAEMIKLLLVTWNAVAHERLDIEEAEPQLAFVAYSMTLQGSQSITKDALERYINEARRLLPELLSYTNISASRFIDQVEERSNLLIQVGLDENEKGQLVPSYEFSHLSFQEYLTAKSIAEEWVTGSNSSTTLDILKLHINEEHWKEVVPLSAVLMARNAKVVVEFLVDQCNDIINGNVKGIKMNDVNKLAPFHLANCIAAEVSISPELLEKAIVAVVKCKKVIDNLRTPYNPIGARDIYAVILKGKYSDIFKETIRKILFEGLYDSYLYEFMNAWTEISKSISDTKPDLHLILCLLESNEKEMQISGALQMMLFAFENISNSRNAVKIEHETINKSIIENIYSYITKMIQIDDEICIYSASWSISWSGYEELNIIPQKFVLPIARRLIQLWTRSSISGDLRRMISWGIFSICSPNFQKEDFNDIEELDSTIKKFLKLPENDFDFSAAFTLAVLMESLKEKDAKKLLSMSKHNMRFGLRSKTSKFLNSRGFDIDESSRKKTPKTK